MKKNLRLLEMQSGEAVEELDLKRISGGMLAQEAGPARIEAMRI